MEASISHITLDDIIFEGRNKEYGAFVLRKMYRRRMEFALLFALGFLSLFVTISIIMAHQGNDAIIPIKKKVISISDIPLPPIEKILPQKVIKLPPPPKTLTTFKITNKIVPKIPKMPTNNAIVPVTTTTIDTTGLANSIPHKIQMPFEIPKKRTQPYVHVEIMPQFPGGTTALYKYLANNVIYPEAARKNNIQGTVYVYFVITSAGTVSDIKILRGLTDAMNKEVIRVIKNMPKWTPGKQNGKVVNVIYKVPCVFKLN